ncbi:MAG: M48 family metallopeptidase [Maricaulaceae bacterium]|nr:M48 family metallopeptidase [Maricaulaceae bacterium]
MPGSAHRIEARDITLAGRRVDYALARSARRRTVGLVVDHGGLRVLVPAHVGAREIERILQDRAGWITEKLDKWAQRPQPEQRRFEAGERLPWLGAHLVLQVRDNPSGARTRVRRDGYDLVVEVDPHLAGESRRRAVKAGLERWYKTEAKRVFAPLLAQYAASLGKPPPKLIVRGQKRRWGSCDPKGVVRMNWRLMGADIGLIAYVCAHECAHLVEANHSPAFWALVARLMPDWKDRRRRLTATGAAITPF